ncbi:MAG: DUF3237 family protein [Lachnospiraceae bacterium]|nr:DUF3237 family protein [Lachnospiraceae bacterium]
MKEKILSIHVELDECFEVRGGDKNVNLVNFHGTAVSKFFSGKILSGGVDTQFQRAGEHKQLSARYMLEGTDCTGKKCRIFIENNGTEGELVTKPSLVTDSEVLSWLMSAALEGRIVNEENGIRIEIYEILSEFERTEHTFEKDGRKIYGELYRPAEDRKCPFLIMSHGYNGCSEGMRQEAERIAARGIAVYSYDFCGGGLNSKSSGRTTEMTIPSEQRDLKDVLGEVEKISWIDKERIYLFGGSQGGFVTALTAPEVADRIQGIFLEFPAFCIPDDWAGKKEEIKEETFEFFGMPLGKCFAEELPDYNVFQYAAKYKGPVLIFHGDSDPVVGLRYSERLVAGYDHAELHVFPKQEHGFEAHFLTVMAGKIKEFCNYH